MTELEKRWWEQWWEEDYSWEGLAKKTWRGWYATMHPDGECIDVFPDHTTWPVGHPKREAAKGAAATVGARGLWRSATLQDYWRDQKRRLIKCPVSGKEFTIMHAPLNWEDGSDAGSIAGRAGVQWSVLRRCLLRSSEVDTDDFTDSGPDFSVQLRGAVLVGFGTVEDEAETQSKQVYMPGINAVQAYFFMTGNFRRIRELRRSVFTDALFSSGADFDGVGVQQAIDFRRGVFLERARFEGCTFRSRFDGSGACFLGGVSFARSVLCSDLQLSNAKISDILDLSSTIILSDAKLGCTHGSSAHALSGGETSWDIEIAAPDALFCGGVSLVGRDLGMKPDFRRAQFFGLAEFFGAKIGSGAQLAASSFKGSLGSGPVWRHAKKGVTFGYAGGWDEVRFTEIIRNCPSYYEKMALGSPDGVELTRYLQDDLRKDPEGLVALMRSPTAATELNGLLKWARVKRPRDTALSRSQRTEYYRSLENSFAALKQLMETNRQRQEEIGFARLEHLARRMRRDRDVGTSERTLSILYEILSDFGQSFIQPMLWLSLLWLGCSVGYAMMASVPVRFPTKIEVVQSANYSMSRALPSGIWSHNIEPCTPVGRLFDVRPPSDPRLSIGHVSKCSSPGGLRDGYGPLTRFGVAAVAALQTILSLVLWFLMALAIRRRFQIG